jgi:hypothetical protein
MRTVLETREGQGRKIEDDAKLHAIRQKLLEAIREQGEAG